MSMQVELKINGPVAFLMFKRPPINALDETALRDLMKTIGKVENDETIRVVIIASGIQGIFCAGGDLKYWPRIYPNQADVVSEAGRNVFTRIEQLTKPSIAVIQGRVIGDGLSLALACDIRLASEDSIFHLPEVGYGFIPGWGTIGRLVEVIGKALTAELLLLGEEISATRAQVMGLVNQIKDPDDLMPFAQAFAERIATKPPMAVRFAKAALRGDSANQSREQTNWESSCFAAVWGSREWKEGIDRLFKVKSPTLCDELN